PFAQRQQLSLEDLQHVKWLAFSHMYGKQTNFDRALRHNDYSMHFSAYVSNFGLAPYFLLDTDYATTMPRLIADKYCRYFDLRIITLQREMREGSMVRVWSERSGRDRLNQWLRSEVSPIVEALWPMAMRVT